MGLLIKGIWHDKWYDTESNGGKFVRSNSQFRNMVTEEDGEFKAETNRYHLYVSLACPWAHRVLIYRSLKKLEDHISVSIVNPYMLEHGWTFKNYEGSTKDHLFGLKYLYEIYLKNNPDYSGRVTVPVLWDKKTNQIINNESSDIIRIFNNAFNSLTGDKKNFYPIDEKNKIDEINQYIYSHINNGVYKTGMASKQEVYEKELKKLFMGLDYIETLLEKNKYLLGNEILECDLRLIPTILRFDAVYVGHFKCNLKRIYDYPKLYEYLEKFKKMQVIIQTTNMEHIKNHYYGSHSTINPSGIVPLGPLVY